MTSVTFWLVNTIVRLLYYIACTLHCTVTTFLHTACMLHYTMQVSKVIVHILNGVLIGDVFIICEGITGSPATLFPPHERVQITGQHIAMVSLHGLESSFTAIPIGCAVLCVRTIAELTNSR